MTSLGTWNGDTFTASDGRVFAIFSEQIRGEPRFYYAGQRNDGGRVPANRQRLGGGIGDREWLKIPNDGAFDKRTARRAVERYVRETLG